MKDLRDPLAEVMTISELLDRLGGVPAHRVRVHPSPGSATEQDVVAIEQRENRLCELVDGVLVEKAMGYKESFFAIVLVEALWAFVRARNLGLVTGADGMMRLSAGLVRIPDVAFVSWDRLPDGRLPAEPIPQVVPNLAVEISSSSNTEGEMARKRAEYFAAGVNLVWSVDLEQRTVVVYTSPDSSRVLGSTGTLEGGDVLPGLALSLADLFAELDRRPNR